MEQNTAPGSAGDDKRDMSQGDDYEYDEAHDALTAPAGRASTARPASPPPKVDVGEGGDYGYDEARDFGRQ